jgi:hypothetical protein
MVRIFYLIATEFQENDFSLKLMPAINITIWFNLLMHSLQNVHEINTYRAGHICLPNQSICVCIIQLNSRRMDWMKFAMDIMPLEHTLKLYSSISYNR